MDVKARNYKRRKFACVKCGRIDKCGRNKPLKRDKYTRKPGRPAKKPVKKTIFNRRKFNDSLLKKANISLDNKSMKSVLRKEYDDSGSEYSYRQKGGYNDSESLYKDFEPAPLFKHTALSELGRKPIGFKSLSSAELSSKFCSCSAREPCIFNPFSLKNRKRRQEHPDKIELAEIPKKVSRGKKNQSAEASKSNKKTKKKQEEKNGNKRHVRISDTAHSGANILTENGTEEETDTDAISVHKKGKNDPDNNNFLKIEFAKKGRQSSQERESKTETKRGKSKVHKARKAFNSSIESDSSDSSS